jgi:hypothetical protein
MLDQIGNWIGDITGWNQAQRGKKDEEATERANAEAQRKAQEQYAQMQQYLGGVVGGGDPMQRAQQQYQQAFQASQQAGADQAQQANRQALMAARTAGLNPGQAAILAGQQTGQNYLAGQQQALGQFRGAQDAATSAQLQAAGMSAGLSVPGLARQQGTDASGAVQGLMGGIGTLAGVGAGIVGGKYAKGTASVPKDMIAEIHEGEIIIPAKASEKIREKAGTMDVKKLARMLDDALGIYKEGDK